MAGNTFGQAFSIRSFGESHGKAIGVVIDGCPAGLTIDLDFIQKEMQRRKPGQSAITTQRQEEDVVEILSGVFENRSTGAPIALLINNKDQRSGDYDRFKEVYRPSHADFTYDRKYGFRDHRGGGRSSARETAARVAAGAIAKLLLLNEEIYTNAYVSRIGTIELDHHVSEMELLNTDNHPTRCPHIPTAERMQALIEKVRDEGDSLGGIITCSIRNCPVGLGEPVFDKLHADLGKAMLSINAVKGFDIGSGFAAAAMRGSEHNDEFINTGDDIKTRTNHSGGVQGGISNGEEILFRVAFKPVATIGKEQNTVSQSGEATTIEGKGRHDTCVVPRAVPIVEAMSAIVIADHLLRNRISRV